MCSSCYQTNCSMKVVRWPLHLSAGAKRMEAVARLSEGAEIEAICFLWKARRKRLGCFLTSLLKDFEDWWMGWTRVRMALPVIALELVVTEGIGIGMAVVELSATGFVVAGFGVGLAVAAFS